MCPDSEGLDIVIEKHSGISGIRDLEQAAEHIAANALYQIEVNHVKQVVFDAERWWRNCWGKSGISCRSFGIGMVRFHKHFECPVEKRSCEGCAVIL